MKAKKQFTDLLQYHFKMFLTHSPKADQFKDMELNTKNLWNLYWIVSDINRWQDNEKVRKLTKDLKDSHLETAIKKAYTTALKEIRS